MDFNFTPWFFQVLAMCLTVAIIPNLRITGIIGPILAVVALSLINSHFWEPSLFFKLPTGFTSQSALLLLMNGLIFWIMVKLLPGIEVDGLLPAVLAPIVFTVTSIVLDQYATPENAALVQREASNFFSHIKSAVSQPR